jgi:hypothetical protein
MGNLVDKAHHVLFAVQVDMAGRAIKSVASAFLNCTHEHAGKTLIGRRSSSPAEKQRFSGSAAF